MNTKTNSRTWSWIQLNGCRAVRAGMLLLFLGFAAPNCLGTSVAFNGKCNYAMDFTSTPGVYTVVLTTDHVVNIDSSASGPLYLELWAFNASSSYKFAKYYLGTLAAGWQFNNVSSGSIPCAIPPPGTWTMYLQVRESVGSGYTTDASIQLSGSLRVAGGAAWEDEELVGPESWTANVSAGTVNLIVAGVTNICNVGLSGNLRLDLWATTTQFTGGTINGTIFGSVPLNSLEGQHGYNNINQTVAYTPPTQPGSYFVTWTLAELHSGTWTMVDYATSSTKLTVGAQTGSLQVTLYPSAAVSAGRSGRWMAGPGRAAA